MDTEKGTSMEFKYPQRLGISLKSFVGLALILFCCFGCVGSGTMGKSAANTPEADVADQGAPPEHPAPAADAREAKDLLLNVSVNEQGDEINIGLKSNTLFKDYQFRRLSEDRFTLELPTINGLGELPALPDSSERVRLAYEELPSSGVQIIGTLKAPLDRYMLNSGENVLFLTLYMEREPMPARSASSGNPSPSAIKSASRPKKSNPDKPKGVAQTMPPQMQDYSSAVPPQPVSAEDSSFSGVMQRASYTGKPISLDLLDADLKNVLRLLADLSGSNIVIEPEVTGKVTLKVEQVPWDQVLDMVLAMNDLGKERIGNVIRIARQGKLKEEWSEKTAEIRARQDLLEASKDLGEIATAYLSVNYAQPSDIAAKIAESKSEKGKISVDERTSLLIYSDYPIRIDAARQLLARLDRATPQVLIEARIITASTDVTKALGVNWDFSSQHLNNTNDDIPFTQQFDVDNIGNIFGFSLAQVVGETLLQVDFQLSALELMNELKIMAAPRVLTLNNTKATITQGTQIPYPAANEFGVISTEFKDATLELQVTPHITPDKRVRLEIKAKQDEPTVQTFQVAAGVAAVGIDTRKIDTELLVDDGSIVVIGGVIRNRDSLSRDATPGLHNIPILGRLFKSETVGTTRTELLIFISPKIVETPRIPAQAMK